MPRLLHRLRALAARHRLDQELDEEMRSHLTRLVQQYRDDGLTEAEARRRAHLTFGALPALREEARDARGLRVVEDVGRDARVGWRRLRRTPGFTTVAVLSLAIGIGANTAVFSVVNTLILRDLPFERPEELVDVHLRLPDLLFPVLSYPDFADLRNATTEVFAGTVGSQLAPVRVTTGEGEEDVFVEAVTGSYFSVLGIETALGRPLGVDDDRSPGAHPVVVLSDGFWRRGFGGDPQVVGRAVRIEDQSYTVVGVARRGYPGISRFARTAAFVPMMMVDELIPADLLTARDNHNMLAKARLAPGVGLPEAEAAVAAVSASLSGAPPEGWDPAGAFSLMPTVEVVLLPGMDEGLRMTAGLLMVAVGLVLLLACVNLAGFLLARTVDRQQELAVRLALGASRGALVRQMLTETTLLGTVGGAVGLGLAVWLLNLATTVDLGLPVAPPLDVVPDRTVLAFTTGLSILAGVGLGLLPALQSTRPRVPAGLTRDVADAGRPAPLRWRQTLVVIQLTVSLVLLVGAGLFVRSLQQRQAIDAGFGHAPTALLAVGMHPDRFPADEGRRYVTRLRDRFRALPGVEALGLINTLPLQGGLQWIDFTVDGHRPPPGQDVFHADRAIVDPGFFDAAGIPLLQGRAFGPADRDGSPRVAIVSEAMARRFWPTGDVVGRQVRLTGGSPALPDAPEGHLEIVGVASDIDWEALNETPRLLIYLPFGQVYSPAVHFVARTSSGAAQTAGALEAAGRELDPDLAVIGDTATMAQLLAEQLRSAQVVTQMLSTFALLALLLAAIGLYGVVSYAVVARTREVGIRMALGADSTAIRRQLARGGLRLVLIGAVTGVVASLLATRWLSSLLFGVEPLDPLAFVGAATLLGATALGAAYLPARRASRLNPVTALRTE